MGPTIEEEIFELVQVAEDARTAKVEAIPVHPS